MSDETGCKFVLKESQFNSVNQEDFKEIKEYMQKAIGIKHHNLITNYAAIVTPNDFALL